MISQFSCWQSLKLIAMRKTEKNLYGFFLLMIDSFIEELM